MTGEKAPIHGKGRLQLGIGSLVVPQELWVADIHDQCILGLDFLKSHGCQVNLKDESLTIGEEEVPLKKSSATPEPTCYKAVLVEGVCLPPLSDTVIPVKMDGTESDYRWGILEQTKAPSSLDGLLVARTLVDLRKKQSPLRVMNLSNQQRILNKGTELACCETINSVFSSQADAGQKVPGSALNAGIVTTLPTPLKELYDCSVSGLPETECREVHKLLCEFTDVFSTGSQDLGSTDLVKHSIHTGEAAPIRQPPRRLPLSKREEAERAVRQMHEQGVIEPSASPWSSPIVLVSKKDGSIRFCVDYRKLNKYIVIIADYFTKWVEAFATSNQEARTVAELLAKEIVCRFGVPQIIHSDQGRNFESQLFAEMCQLFGIKKTRTTPYHPQSNGMVERFNRTLETQLSKFADLNQKDWDMHIPYLLLAYRSAIHDTTGCSPARMMLGREVNLPIDLMFGRPEEEPAPTATDYANTLQNRLERVHNFARAHMQAKVDRMKQRYDLPQECQCLDPGDAAWLHNPQRKKGLSPKLQRPWQGPYIIIKRINDLVYRIQLGPHTKPKVVHRNRLWRYSGLCAPTWYKAAGEERGASPSSEAPSDRPLNIESPIGGLQALPGNLPGLRSVPDSPSTQLRRSGRSRQPPDRYGT